MITKYKIIEDIISDTPKDDIIVNSYLKCFNIINNRRYKNIMCSVSGGKDSDIMLDMVYRCDIDNKVNYVFFDTGLEYEATKQHLCYLENRYNIQIWIEKACMPIVLSVKRYGVPFLSKEISKKINSLQKHNFLFTDKTYEEHVKENNYPKDSISWWDNYKHKDTDSDRYFISRRKYLREFMIENKPDFTISSECCEYSKKKTSKKYILSNNVDLLLTGIRKSEGGQRSISYDTCYYEESNIDKWTSLFMPIFWYKQEHVKKYIKYYDIVNSDCYSLYGFLRTGCACCPFAGRKVFDELKVIKCYEPKLYKAVNNVFGKSYEYTENYYNYRDKMLNVEKQNLKKQKNETLRKNVEKALKHIDK